MAGELTTDERREFADRCRAVLAVATAPGTPETMAQAKAFQTRLVEAGLAGLPYATEHGGAGLTQEHGRIYREVAQDFPPMANKLVISHGMCLPVLNEFGTEAQKRQFMPDNIAARTVWCQLFSEPGAGSDVASLQTRAVRDGDEWTLNGQKVWTTLAHESDFGVIIARTDPDQPKHAGISMFVVDMHAPGVEVRPINQIDGGRHFNEVFFTDVRIPADWLLGTYNDGWRQATAMLMFERLAIGSMGAGAISQPRFDRLIDVARRSGALADPVVRDQLMQLYAMETTKALVAMRTRADVAAGKAPGPGGSLGKLAGSVIAWRFRDLAFALAGPSAQAWSEDEPDAGGLAFDVVTPFSAGIAGGTDEIQRNIIGERVLGLPRDITVDRDVAFKDLKVGTQRAGS
ncbi:MAG: acyl-CoA dehydrogenase family protein [Actinobacteria bacterium]|nr:acyl-CoA dehydrogenase family protein [Actinomycetota bacterium]